jgi:hypothetical protein
MVSIESAIPVAARAGAASAVAVRRYVNDEIARIGARVDAGETTAFEFLCECGRLGCDGLVTLTLADYAERAPGTVVAHG